MDIYLYYTIREVDAAMANVRVTAMQQRLANAYTITTSLRRRPEIRDGLQTWMEIYLNVPAAFDRVIEQAAVEEGVSELAATGRHVEYFMELPPCA